MSLKWCNLFCCSTVCEGCGERHDEARLLLCDECDISYHIYCMEPPLDYVPQGNCTCSFIRFSIAPEKHFVIFLLLNLGKCKWCAVCTVCGSSDPGVNSSWLANYSLCGPCSSLRSCPVCSQSYSESDLIVQCGHCVRWLHGRCDRINTEAEAELCFSSADDAEGNGSGSGYNCPLCRIASDPLPAHLQPGNAKALMALNQAFAAAAAIASGVAPASGRNSSNSNSPTPPSLSLTPTAATGNGLVTSPTTAAAAAAAAAVAVAAALTTDRPKSSASTSSTNAVPPTGLSSTPTPSQLFVVDGVSLSEGGMNYLRSLQLLDQPRRRCRGKNKAQQAAEQGNSADAGKIFLFFNFFV